MKLQKIAHDTIKTVGDFLLEAGLYVLGMMTAVTGFAAEIHQPSATFGDSGMTVGFFGSLFRSFFTIWAAWALLIFLIRLWPTVRRMFDYIDSALDEREIQA